MNKTGLKTFVFSFGITLSVILGVDRAVFITPKYDKDVIKIPRKNITLFFNSSNPVIGYLQTEPVQRVSLETPEFKSEELEIAYNIPQLSDDMLVGDELLDVEGDEIPLQTEDATTFVSINEDSEREQLAFSDVPLSYSDENIKVDEEVLSEVSPIADEPADNLVVTQAEKVEKTSGDATDIAYEHDLLTQPIVIKGTRQIIKIDNLKAKQDELKNNNVETKESNILLAHKIKALNQNDDDFEELDDDTSAVADVNQVASLTENIPLTDEEQDRVDVEEKPIKTWQTMAEKQQEENPWVVARGSKFVKNKQVLKEEFSSELAQDKANIILSPAKSVDKNVKLAVQDNLLIPIPKEILDEDNLVPSLGDDILKRTEKKKNVKKDKEKEGSFLDSIASVFSKENREKAIKRIKEKSSGIIKDAESDEDEKIQILPTEIRLSFQPNRAEISGQTLRWIQAFAKKTVDEKDVGLEIRIDGSKSFELQQKRLTLLYNILTTNGVAYDKINTLFVDREPNSFVVRAVKMLNGGEAKKEIDGWKKYYQKW